MKSRNPTNNLTYYDEEMEQCAEEYAQYCSSVVENVKKVCKDPVVLIEQKLDFPKYVPEGFGTGDCVIIGDGTLYVIDYKHGKGVEVQADNNSQMMCYALGALNLFDGIYDITEVSMTIFQPRRENVSTFVMKKKIYIPGQIPLLHQLHNWYFAVKESLTQEITASSVR